MSQTFIMQFLTNSPSVKGRAALAISATSIKLGFTAASLCDLASGDEAADSGAKACAPKLT